MQLFSSSHDVQRRPYGHKNAVPMPRHADQEGVKSYVVDQKSTRWCGVGAWRGECQLRYSSRHLTTIQIYEVRLKNRLEDDPPVNAQYFVDEAADWLKIMKFRAP
ncbi:hypothetical protein AVEN_112549-1 [Araneus ventricosus]|uniref:Uncharacterized protein n=1 Tax=Araneus ventricosus TaxID=182803 RepID=A0A4Y2IPY7_ARAVE|nr:hypothetical protein AVEN_112549-1 [Araneus ventricosus]